MSRSPVIPIVRRVSCQCGRNSIEIPWHMRVIGLLCPKCDTGTAGNITTTKTYLTTNEAQQ